MKNVAYHSSSRNLVKIYEEVHRVLEKENRMNADRRASLGRLEIACDLMRRLMFGKGIQLKEPLIYSLGDRAAHVKWTGYHIGELPIKGKVVRGRHYSLVLIIPPNYSRKSTTATYSLTMGHKISEGVVQIAGKKRK